MVIRCKYGLKKRHILFYRFTIFNDCVLLIKLWNRYTRCFIRFQLPLQHIICRNIVGGPNCIVKIARNILCIGINVTSTHIIKHNLWFVHIGCLKFVAIHLRIFLCRTLHHKISKIFFLGLQRRFIGLIKCQLKVGATAGIVDHTSMNLGITSILCPLINTQFRRRNHRIAHILGRASLGRFTPAFSIVTINLRPSQLIIICFATFLNSSGNFSHWRNYIIDLAGPVQAQVDSRKSVTNVVVKKLGLACGKLRQLGIGKQLTNPQIFGILGRQADRGNAAVRQAQLLVLLPQIHF